MKSRVKLIEAEQKLKKDGMPYYRFKCQTAVGSKWISCFDVNLCNELKAQMGEFVDLEVQEKGGFMNITGRADGVVEEQAASERPVVVDNKYQTMFVSYAKDIFLEIIKEPREENSFESCMETAIMLVKQAREAF